MLRMIQNEMEFTSNDRNTGFQNSLSCGTMSVPQMALAKKYTDFSELTPQMIYEFVEKIIVHAPEKIDGERTQEVEIQLKYIGSFDLPESPLPDPTPEEIAAEEKKQRRREANHRYYEKRKNQDQAAQKNEEEKSA